MRHFIFLFFVLLCLTACNDGDILEVGLEFDKSLAFCDQSTTTYLVYDTKQDPYESLSLLFPKNATTSVIFTPLETNHRDTLDINGSTVRFNYRTYNGNPGNLLCQLVPDPNTNIINDYESTSGKVYITSTFIDDDEDGIPSNVEDMNLDGDDDPATNPTDSDNDGIPDYKDADDDNDNILTIFEHPNYSVENGLSEALNTDGDTYPDYLDDDDDGDGVLTRYEDEDGNLDPRNDFDEDSSTPDIARYLNPTATDSFTVDTLVTNKFKRNYTIAFNLVQIDLQILSTDELYLGTYKYSVITE